MRTSHAPSANPLTRNPLFAIAAAFAFGIFLDGGLDADPRFVLFGFILVLASTIFYKSLLTVCVLTSFVCAGALVSGLDRSGSPMTGIAQLMDKGWIKSGDPVRVRGNLDDHPQLSVGGVFLSVSADRIKYKRERIPTSGTLRMFLATDSEASEKCLKDLELTVGDQVRISARLKREDSFLNPGTVSTIDSLNRRGIDATATIKSCFLVKKTGDSVSILSFAYQFREALTQRIIETHDRRTAGIVLASLLGNKNFLTKNSGDTFRENNTFHVLVISGLHITLIGGLILLAVRRLTSNRRAQFVFSNAFLWAYAALVGLQLPVFRAALMYSVFLLGYTAYREASPLNSLGASALTILVWRPADLFNPSFQLTFMSILAIIGFAFPLIKKVRSTGAWMPTAKHPFPPIAAKPVRIVAEVLYWSELRWSSHLKKQNWNCAIEKTAAGRYFADTLAQVWAKRCFEIGVVSFSVQLFLLPLLILNFHRFGTASLFANLFAGAAVVAQNFFSLTGLAVSLVNIEAARSFVSMSAGITDLSLFLQDSLSHHLFTPVRIPVYTGFFALIYPLYYLPLAGFVICAAIWNPFALQVPRKSVRSAAYCSLIFVAGLAALMLFHPFSEPAPEARLRVDFLDVGQGDSSLVTFPGGRTLLIDGGGQREFDAIDSEKRDVAGIGEKVVSEFLWEKGYSTVDFVLSTHPDADHINGLTEVLANFDVKKVFVGGDFTGVGEFERFKAAANEKGLPVIIISEGMVLDFGGAKVSVLNPPQGRIAKADNDDSLVLLITLNARSFLFTGDIGTRTEKRLCDSDTSIAADVVKVAHHGSRTSSSACFVERTNAAYAIIPVGKNSPYGHPHEEVLNGWEKEGSKVFSVGERGTVSVSTDGSDLRIEFFDQPFR